MEYWNYKKILTSSRFKLKKFQALNSSVEENVYELVISKMFMTQNKMADSFVSFQKT